jgi:hypothetical protein
MFSREGSSHPVREEVMNRGVIGTIVGILVVIILILVIMRLV